jgi:hypothetical protein
MQTLTPTADPTIAATVPTGRQGDDPRPPCFPAASKVDGEPPHQNASQWPRRIENVARSLLELIGHILLKSSIYWNSAWRETAAGQKWQA